MQFRFFIKISHCSVVNVLSLHNKENKQELTNTSSKHRRSHSRVELVMDSARVVLCVLLLSICVGVR